MAEKPRMRIVVLGGGTAGWMTANLLARHWGERVAITVIESSEIGIVGVGEGSTPHLRGFFDKLGLQEADWMPHCHASYKVGIRFDGWSERPGFESYFHPFRSAVDQFTLPTFFGNTMKRRRGVDLPVLPDHFTLHAHLAANRLAPKASENFPFQVAYGYHFDSGLLGNFLRDLAVKSGITHLDTKIQHVAVNDQGLVTHLVGEDGGEIAGDLFMDASGFRSVIVQQALGVKFLPFAENLFNDSAVVMPSDPDPEGVAPQTVSATLKNGWVFRIPLTHRTGNGYVYSSRYCTAEEAEAELKAYVGKTGMHDKVRHLKMRVGQVEATWVGNCVAVGLSQGFIEPLEATALHIVRKSVEDFIKAFESGGFTPRHRDAFNKKTRDYYEGIRDYIVCHYKLASRSDTEYWRDCAANRNISDSLRGMIRSWFAGEDIRREIARQGIGNYWGDLPWHSIFAGYGCFPDESKLKPPRLPSNQDPLFATRDFIRRCGLNFPNHAKLLEQMAA